jgi:hypothetical protein
MAGSFKTDILPLFRPEDIDCMSEYGVLLDNYEWMSNPDNAHANATNVYLRLTGKRKPRMPEGGPYWNEAQLKKLNDWMTVDPTYQP